MCNALIHKVYKKTFSSLWMFTRGCSSLEDFFFCCNLIIKTHLILFNCALEIAAYIIEKCDFKMVYIFFLSSTLKGIFQEMLIFKISHFSLKIFSQSLRSDVNKNETIFWKTIYMKFLLFFILEISYFSKTSLENFETLSKPKSNTIFN